MKTADRLLTGTLGPPFSQSRYPEHAAEWRSLMDDFKRFLPAVPHLLADNVARLVHSSDKAYCLEEFPCLAPPWPCFWIEYPSRSGRQRRGVVVRDVTEHRGVKDESAAGAEEDARANGYEGEIKWVVEFTLFAENQRKQVIGPMGWVFLALDPRGRCVGNRWVIGIPRDAGKQSVDGDADERYRIGQTMQALTDTNTDTAAANSTIDDLQLTAGLLAAYQTVALLHCRNVVRDPVDVSEKLDKRHKKDHGRPLLRFQTIRLDVPRKSRESRHATGTPAELPLHIVAGSFHHYGNCCPPTCAGEHDAQACKACGGHLPHGLLFGRLEGIYWVPQHARGDRQRGEVRTDFRLEVAGD